MKPINIYIIHQCVIDTVACIITLITKYINNDINILSGEIGQMLLCRFVLSRSLMWSVIHASGYNLMFLTIETYKAIVFPLHHQREVVFKRLPLTFTICWIIGFASMFPTFSTSRVKDEQCVPYVDLHSNILSELLSPYYVTIACLIPSSGMFYSYFHIFKSIGTSLNKSKKLQKAQSNLVQTCAILCVMFVGCWFLHAAIFMLYFADVFEKLDNDLFHISNILIVFNSCANPYVYSFRYAEFQKQALKLLRIKL